MYAYLQVNTCDHVLTTAKCQKMNKHGNESNSPAHTNIQFAEPVGEHVWT